jgi:hypothetical protein
MSFPYVTRGLSAYCVGTSDSGSTAWIVIALVRRVRGTYTSDGGFTLTTEGRDLCIAQNLQDWRAVDRQWDRYPSAADNRVPRLR